MVSALPCALLCPELKAKAFASMVRPRDRAHHAPLFGLFSLVALWTHDPQGTAASLPGATSWYRKPLLTFSDALAAVHRQLCARENFHVSANAADLVALPRTTINRLIHATC